MGTARTVNSMPLKNWLGQQGHGSRARLAKRLKLKDQAVLTNWLSRGIPLHAFPEVCEAIGMSEDRYRSMAGLPVKGRVQGDLDAPALMADFDKLPPGLRGYIARKARELREIWEQNPVLHVVFTPPKDPSRYREWEREIEGLIQKLRPGE